MAVHVALPGLEGFDDERVRRRREERAARRPRRIVAGVALLVAGPLLALWYAWDDVALGRGAFDTASTGTLRWLPFATVVVGALAIASVVAGGRLAIERDGRLSRAWIVGSDIVVVLGLLTVGATALLPTRFARSLPSAAAAAAEAPGRTWYPGIPECQPAIDPTAFRPWIENADVCGLANTGRGDGLSFVEHDVAPNGDRHGLYYAPDRVGDAYGLCVRHLDGGWFELAWPSRDTMSCPEGLGSTPGSA